MLYVNNQQQLHIVLLWDLLIRKYFARISHGLDLLFFIVKNPRPKNVRFYAEIKND